MLRATPCQPSCLHFTFVMEGPVSWPRVPFRFSISITNTMAL